MKDAVRLKRLRWFTCHVHATHSSAVACQWHCQLPLLYLPMIGVSTTAGCVSANPKHTDPRYIVAPCDSKPPNHEAQRVVLDFLWAETVLFALKPWGLAESPSDQPLVRGRGGCVSICSELFGRISYQSHFLHTLWQPSLLPASKTLRRKRIRCSRIVLAVQ